SYAPGGTMNEIEWLAERRPESGEPDAAATSGARAALLEHARTPRLKVSRRPVHVRRRIIAGGVLVAAAAGVPFPPPPAGEHASPIAPRLAPPAAEAAPLVRLAAHIQETPPPAGDATLVLRKHDFPNAKSFTGADMYLDSGRYYYGATL